jgi:hypothetical protein
MGNVQISNASQTIKDYQSFMSQVYSSLNVNASCKSVGSNEMTIFAGALPNPKNPSLPSVTCPFTAQNTTIMADQTVTSQCNATVNTSDQITSDVSTQIQQKILQFLQQQQASNQGWLAAAINSQVSNINDITSLANRISQSVRNTTSEVCSTSAQAYNQKEVVLCGVYDDDNLDFNQIAVSNAYLSCTVDLMIKAWQSDQALTEVAQKSFTSQTSRQAGIASLFDSLFGWIIVIVGGIIIIAVIFGIIYFLSDTGGGEKRKGISEGQLLRLEDERRAFEGEPEVLPPRGPEGEFGPEGFGPEEGRGRLLGGLESEFRRGEEGIGEGLDVD